MLNPNQVSRCRDQGVLVLPGFRHAAFLASAEAIHFQDATFLITAPDSVAGFCFALDATPWPTADAATWSPQNWLQRPTLPCAG